MAHSLPLWHFSRWHFIIFVILLKSTSKSIHHNPFYCAWDLMYSSETVWTVKCALYMAGGWKQELGYVKGCNLLQFDAIMNCAIGKQMGCIFIQCSLFFTIFLSSNNHVPVRISWCIMTYVSLSPKTEYVRAVGKYTELFMQGMRVHI